LFFSGVERRPFAKIFVVLVSILICTRNRAEQLRETLKAMSAVALPADMSAELLVIDNGSTDATATIVRAQSSQNMILRYVRAPLLGQCQARNAGLAAALGDIILFTDDDVRPPIDWVERMCAPILRGDAEIVAGGVELAQHLRRPWMSACHRSWLACTDAIDPKRPQRFVGANFGFSRTVLEKVPSFDVELGPGAYGFFDETLFACQLTEAGFRIAPALDVIVEHHCDESRLTRASFLDSARKLGRSFGYLQYHWEQPETWRKWWRLLDAMLRLLYWRIRLAPRWRENAHEREIQAVMRVYTCLQFIREQKRPRNYSRHGLVKINGILSRQRGTPVCS
jgi:glycosyltransferase involved in cell wall biosynthesis